MVHGRRAWRNTGRRWRHQTVYVEAKCSGFAVCSLLRKLFPVEGQIDPTHISCPDENLFVRLYDSLGWRYESVSHYMPAIRHDRQPGVLTNNDLKCERVGFRSRSR